MPIDVSTLQELINIPIVGVCFLCGFVIKNYISFISNRFIPLIMLFIGIVVSLLINTVGGELIRISLTDIVSGGLSGLASTGVYELIMNTFKIEKQSNKSEDENHS